MQVRVLSGALEIDMKKKPEDATIEEVLSDVCYWEDIDSALIVSSTEEGGAFVMEYDGGRWASAPTLKEALIKLQRMVFEKNPWMFDEDNREYHKLDWA